MFLLDTNQASRIVNMRDAMNLFLHYFYKKVGKKFHLLQDRGIDETKELFCGHSVLFVRIHHNSLMGVEETSGTTRFTD